MDNQSRPEQIIIKNVKPRSTVIIAVSGGVDSVYLLHLCHKIIKQHPFKMVVAHLDHNFRRQSSKDRAFVQNIATKLNLPFETEKLKKLTGGNIEERFREARYSFLESIRKRFNADWILTGHHLNDNIETILLNITRGTSFDGLSGMRESDPKRHLLRPLINTPKTQIIADAKKSKLKHVRDVSNFDTTFSRNRIRQNVIPELKKINPSLEQTFLQNIQNWQQTKSDINDHINLWITRNFTRSRLPLDRFLKLPPSFQSSVLATIYKKYYGSTNKFNTAHLKQIMTIINQQYSNRKKEFGRHYFIAIERATTPKQKNKSAKYIAFHPKLEKKR